MTAAEIRQLAALGLNAEQLATVAEMMDIRAAARPTSTARVRRWRELRREREREWEQAQGFPPQEDTCARPAPLPAEPASRPWNSPNPAHGIAAAQPRILAFLPSTSSTQSTAAPITATPAAAPQPTHRLQRHETFHPVSETFHRVSETPAAVSAPSPPPSLSPTPPIPPAPAPAPAHRPPPAPAGAHACAHEGSGWVVRMTPGHDGPFPIPNQIQISNQNQPSGGPAPGRRIGFGLSGDADPDPRLEPAFVFDMAFDPDLDPDRVRLPNRPSAFSPDQCQDQRQHHEPGQSQGQGQGQAQDQNPDPGSGFVSRPERRIRHRAQAGSRPERRRRTPVPPAFPQPVSATGTTAAAATPGTPPMTLETATAAAGSHGVTAIIAEKWWLDLDARGWTDSKGRPITRPWSSLRSYAIAWRAHEARDQAMAEAMLLRATGGGHSQGQGSCGGGGGAAAGVDEADWVDGVDRRPGTGFSGAMGAPDSISRFGAGGRHRLSGPSSAAGQGWSRSRSRSAGQAPYYPSEKLEIKYL